MGSAKNGRWIIPLRNSAGQGLFSCKQLCKHYTRFKFDCFYSSRIIKCCSVQIHLQHVKYEQTDCLYHIYFDTVFHMPIIREIALSKPITWTNCLSCKSTLDVLQTLTRDIGMLSTRYVYGSLLTCLNLILIDPNYSLALFMLLFIIFFYSWHFLLYDMAIFSKWIMQRYFHLYSIWIYYMLYSRLHKYNSKLYSDNFTVKLSEYNFHCSRTIFGGRIKLIAPGVHSVKYISILHWNKQISAIYIISNKILLTYF